MPQSFDWTKAKTGYEAGLWCVLRRDFNQTNFVMVPGLSENCAVALAEEFQARGHHQTYRTELRPDLLEAVIGDPAP